MPEFCRTLLCAVMHCCAECNGRPDLRVNKNNQLHAPVWLRTRWSGVRISPGAPINRKGPPRVGLFCLSMSLRIRTQSPVRAIGWNRGERSEPTDCGAKRRSPEGELPKAVSQSLRGRSRPSMAFARLVRPARRAPNGKRGPSPEGPFLHFVSLRVWFGLHDSTNRASDWRRAAELRSLQGQKSPQAVLMNLSHAALGKPWPSWHSDILPFARHIL